jgi:hypothetical protein
MQDKELGIKNFRLIVDYDPEWLRLTIPAVIPLEVGLYRELHLKYSPSNRHNIYVKLKARYVAHEFLEFIDANMS